MEQRIEYAVADQTGTIQLMTSTDRERAFNMARRWNDNPKNGERFTVMDRTVTITDWKPANTGVVGPHGADGGE